MTYIKKLVVKGFKSFAKETEVQFSRGMNVVVGPNGAGKSNVSDALCFVLGRLGMKSMRASLSTDLIFRGTPLIKPAHEASVEVVFNNSSKKFNIDKEDVSIKRIVRQNGQSIYKINDETRTRQEVLELLAQAEIDPYGFNIILQGEIDSFVKMHPEERRKIIEEVAGISIYERRKEKSLHELEATDEKLKEIGMVLRQRGEYLNGLEQDRKDALKFKSMGELAKRCKASIIFKDRGEKEKSIKETNDKISSESKKAAKTKEEAESVQKEINEINEKIIAINKQIQDSSGIGSDKLHEDISNLRVEVGGLSIKKENLENNLNSLLKRREELKKQIDSYEQELKELRKKSPAIAKKHEGIRKKKEEFEKIDDIRKKFYTLKSEINSLKGRITDKKEQLRRIRAESDFCMKQAEDISKELFDKRAEINEDSIRILKEKILSLSKELENLSKSEIAAEKGISAHESEIKNLEEIKLNVSKFDICPLCKSKITEEHVGQVKREADEKAAESSRQIKRFSQELGEINRKRSGLADAAQSLKNEISRREGDRMRISSIKDKSEQIKALEDSSETLKKEIEKLETERSNLERLAEQQNDIEERHKNLRLEIEEISSRTEENVDNTILFKERELERARFIVKRSLQDEQDTKEQISEIEHETEENQELLDTLEEKEKKLTEQFKKHLAERNTLQDRIRERENHIINKQHELRQEEDAINNLRIMKAQLDSEHKSMNGEFLQLQVSEEKIIHASKEKLAEKLVNVQNVIVRIGSVNMRAIEVYDGVKKEYDVVAEKAQKLGEEKDEIMNIIKEIDNKKKKTFNRTLNELNALFERNFTQLSDKGTASLDVENKDDPFAGGVYIIIKEGKGKYFNAASLSGGEQALVAVSLIFAIQEYKPYSFYILDEIDAALDKRNSERLAASIKKFLQSGQYIIITHNDALITESDVLYGVSMYEKVSKIYSLPV